MFLVELKKPVYPLPMLKDMGTGELKELTLGKAVAFEQLPSHAHKDLNLEVTTMTDQKKNVSSPSKKSNKK